MREKKLNRKKKIALKILLIVLIGLVIYAGYITYKASKLGGGLQGFVAATMGHSEETVKNMPKIQCLLIGKSQNLTDTIIVASYNPQKQEATMLSIPRDTFIGTNKANATGMHKINALYQQSPEKLLKAVNNITGLDIKYYIMVDTKALKELVDEVGGVTFNVPIDMNYDDTSQDLHIHLNKGEQLLDGEQAEGLVRFRKNNNGTGYPKEYGSDDYGRMRTQREFIIATIKQTLQAKNILKISELLDIANRNIETNMKISMIKDYIPYVINFNTENIKTGALPGASEKIDKTDGTSIWIFVHNKKQTKNLVGEMFLDKPSAEEIEENSKINIEILYLANKTEKVEWIEEELTSQGYKITKTEITSAPKTIIINRKQMTEEQTEKIQAYFLNARMEEGEDIGEYNYTIIVGNDYE